MQNHFREVALQSLFTGDTRGALPVLETMGDPARRIEILETIDPGNISAYRLKFDRNDESFLRQKLTTWGAAPDQIEMIVGRLRNATHPTASP